MGGDSNERKKRIMIWIIFGEGERLEKREIKRKKTKSLFRHAPCLCRVGV